MIEWIPIKNFNFIDGEQIFECHKNEFGNEIAVARFYYEDEDEENGRIRFPGYKITHVAHVVFPPEKKIFDKISEHYAKEVWGTTPDKIPDSSKIFVRELVDIVKQHYEGEK